MRSGSGGETFQARGWRCIWIFFDAQNRYLNKQELGNENLLMIPRKAQELGAILPWKAWRRGCGLREGVDSFVHQEPGGGGAG